MLTPIQFIQELMLSVLLGSLIGLEREKDHHQEDKHEFGGIRTMALASFYGYLTTIFFVESPLLFGILCAAFLALVVSSYILSAIIYKKTGATTELAAFFVFMIGVLVAQGENLIATVITLAVVSLLYFKEALHQFAHTLERDELYSAIKFLAVAFVVLPLLPKEAVDSLGVLSPYTIWLMIVLVSSISFLSYIGVKAFGTRYGIGLSGFLGGLMSSTAVAMSFSQISKKNRNLVYPLVFGILIAASAMFFRVLAEVFVLNQELILPLLTPMLLMGSSGGIMAVYFWLAGRKEAKRPMKDEDLKLKSPFQLLPAIKFGLIFAIILVLSKLAHDYLGHKGLYLTAFLSGLVDVDAMTISMANLSKTSNLELDIASTAIGIAAITNTLMKGLIVSLFASRKVSVRIIASMVIMTLFGLFGILFLNPILYGTALL